MISRKVKYSLLLYIPLLAVSWIVMERMTTSQPDASKHWSEIKISTKGNNTSETAFFRYRKLTAKNKTKNSIPVLLLHGSPMDSSSFNPLLEALPKDRDYIVPDLPGFGYSSDGFNDFSFIAHRDALNQLLNEEGIDAVHVVAYSQGGGPALHLYEEVPEKIASLTLLSSIGVQEHELTGDYFLNHVLHGFQLIALQAVRWGTPHFGQLDRFLLNTRYAKNFYYSDMRPLRKILQHLEIPTLIIHGTTDSLVPPSAAIEYARIIPQSEIRWYDSGHMLLMRTPQKVANDLDAFLNRVESKSAISRKTATTERIIAATPERSGEPREMGHFIFGLTLFSIGTSTLISEDLSCIIAGLLAGRSIISLPYAIAACFLGIWIGDMLLYAVGRFGGRWLIEKRPLCWFITIDKLTPASQWLEQRGAATIFISRFMPGTRLPLYLASGVLKVPVKKMMLWLALAGLLWTIPAVSLVAYFGQHMIDWLEHSGKTTFPKTLLLIAVLWFIIKSLPQIITSEGRKILLIKWQRFRRWEFWPRSAFYGPLLPFLAGIALKRRKILAFTACNPGIPQSGIIGESKWDILKNLQSSGNVPLGMLLEATDTNKTTSVENWMQSKGLDFPIILKPDQGERGDGVRIIHSKEDLAANLETLNETTIAQSYVEGAEYGVLYIRPPEAERGFIFSLTRKTMTFVYGDGISCLKDLILHDSRAALSYKHFFKIHEDRLLETPSKGEVVVLASIGSHSCGSLFETGMDLITPELEKEIDRIASSFHGFNLGRFDIRCPSEASLKKGHDLRIIELNGVTSEPTHIYHPHTSLREAYATVLRQWRWAYDIGLANAKDGSHISTWQEMFQLLKTNQTP